MRVTGVVREVVSPVSRWRAEVDGRKEHGTQDGVFVIEHEGADLRIEARGDMLRGDDRSERIAWSDVVARFGRQLGQTAPFAETKVTILELAAGMTVAVEGEVTEHAFADDGGLRDAPTKRPSALVASLVGVGDDAVELVERALAKQERLREDAAAKQEAAKQAAPVARVEAAPSWTERALEAVMSMTLSSWLDLAVMVIGLVLLIIAAVVANNAEDKRPAIAFAAGVIVATLGLRPGAAVEPFRAREKVHGRVVHLDLVGRCIAYVFTIFPLAMGLGLSTGDVPAGPNAEKDGAAVIAAFGLLTVGALAVGEVVARPTIRWLARLASRGAIEGVIRAKKPVVVGERPAVLARSEEWETAWTTNSKGNRTSGPRMKSAGFSSAASMSLETKDGTFEIAPNEVAWASTEKFRHQRDGSGWQIHRIVPADAKVVAHGEREGKKLRTKGLAPVLIFAGPDDPRRWAARAVRGRWCLRVVLVAAPPVLVWASGWLG